MPSPSRPDPLPQLPHHQPSPSRPVWSLAVRVLHWCLAATVLASLATALTQVAWHEASGWGVLGCITARLVWGLVGPAHERMRALFVRWRSPVTAWRYARQMVRGAPPDPVPLGHNPLGAYMVGALLLLAASTGLSGVLLTTDRFWGDAWLAHGHEVAAWSLLGLVFMHVLGVFWTSRRQGTRLVRAMIGGTR